MFELVEKEQPAAVQNTPAETNGTAAAVAKPAEAAAEGAKDAPEAAEASGRTIETFNESYFKDTAFEKLTRERGKEWTTYLACLRSRTIRPMSPR